MKRYDRNSDDALTLQTVNPCNSFIVDYLMRCKIRSEKIVSSRYFMYNLAIESVKKYPIPLLTENQLIALEGFGQFFTFEVGKLIDRHYIRGRLPTEEEMEKEEKEHFEAIRENQKRMSEKRKKKKQKQFEEESQFDDRSDMKSVSGLSESKSKYSIKSASSTRSYIPRINTEPFTIIRIMKNLGADKKPVTKGDINESLFNENGDKIKSWFMVRERLVEHGYVEPDQKDTDLLYLTQKSLKLLSKNENCIKKDEENSDLQQFEEPKVSEANSSMKKKSHKKVKEQKKGKKNDYQNETVVEKEAPEKPEYLYEKGKVRVGDIHSLRIIMNLKSKGLNDDMNKLQESFKDKLEFSEEEAQVGDFLWYLEDKVLDLVVLRFKASEIDEDQLNLTINQLRKMKCLNISVIFEFSQPSGESLPKQLEQMLQQCIFNTRINGIHVIKTKNLEETAQCLMKITKQIVFKIEDSRKFKTTLYDYGSLKNFNNYYIEMNLTTVEQYTEKMLLCIPGMNQLCIKSLLSKMPTLRSLYVQLRRLQDLEQRCKMLNWLLRESNPNSNAIKILVQLMELNEDQMQ